MVYFPSLKLMGGEDCQFYQVRGRNDLSEWTRRR